MSNTEIAAKPSAPHHRPSGETARGRNAGKRSRKERPPKRPVIRTHVTDRAFLPAALEVIETPPSPVAVSLTITICAFMAAALAWCWFGRLDIYATARGKIEPAGHAKVIQPLETGKIASIFATEGATVKSGDVLLQLDTSEVETDVASAWQAATAATAEAMRRQAAIEAVKAGNWGRPIVIDWPDDFPATTRSREEQVLVSDLLELSATLANLEAQRREKEATVRQLEGSIAAENNLIETLNERVTLRQTLIDKAVGTRTNLLDAVQALREAQTQIAGDKGRRDQAAAAVASVVTERTRTLETFLSDNSRKMVDARRIADQKLSDRAKSQVRLERMTLRAPVEGLVQSLVVTTQGQVVSSGQELMRIVPSNTPVEIQAYITNDDIGFISVGQEAVVKIDSFPFSRYGTLTAVVKDVASDAVPADTANRALLDPTRRSDTSAQSLTPTAPPMTDLVFEAKLTPSAYVIEVNGRRVPLTPGMTVTVEVKTGSRRILEYLFSPLLEIAGKAMRER